MLTLYDNPISPFARKVRIFLDFKGVGADILDGLDTRNRERLARVNKRVEVPAIDHDGVIVVGSSDIVAYLERVLPGAPLVPADGAEFVRARAWERCADTVVDAILTNISYWGWAERPDAMPEGLLDAARADMEQIYAALEAELRDREFLCGAVSIAEVALFPHLTAVRQLRVDFDGARFPNVLAWFKRMRAMEPFANDVIRAKAYVAATLRSGAANIERRKLFWRNDRIEWMLARGFSDWFQQEIAEDRVIWPGLGVPTPR